jgi:flagellar biosynthetic protein FlhB
LNPIPGIGRMFSTEMLVEMVKTIVKSLLVGGVAWWVISGNLPAIMALIGEPVHEALSHTLQLVVRSCALITGSLLLVAAIDVPYQLWSHSHKLRMSREDLRQEQKESDGDPQVKAQIRRQQQQMAKRRMMSEVPKADIIVTNPTHFAVALKYSDKERAPRVIAKGTDLVALRIRALAEEHKIPVLEAPPLTRALYRHTRLDAEIPVALYAAVAEVLAWAYQLNHQAKEGGAVPPAPTNLPVPESLDIQESAA